METMTWGLLGPEKIESARRTRTLGVAAAVRAFNDLAVPGLGGVWFGKQIVLATLGVYLAKKVSAKHSNIKVANAVEALACGLGLALLKNNQIEPHHRALLRGTTKLSGKSDFSFKAVSKTGFYVTQPMRMATVQTLPALGLVTSDTARFNAFECTESGQKLVEAALGDNGIKCLVEWIGGKDQKFVTDLKKALSSLGALSPLKPLNTEAKELLLSGLAQRTSSKTAANNDRRRKALEWVESMRNDGTKKYTDWTQKPPELDASHWKDLQVGTDFYIAREAAIRVLDAMELHIQNKSTERFFKLGDKLPETMRKPMADLRTVSKTYLAHGHEQAEARNFCNECQESDDARLLRHLVQRDGRVLQLRNECVITGPASDNGSQKQTQDGDDGNAEAIANAAAQRWPENISIRVRNLFLLNADLRGDLKPWLEQFNGVEGESQ